MDERMSITTGKDRGGEGEGEVGNVAKTSIHHNIVVTII